jgi:ketosteroid isomerase-like protein
MTTTRRAVLAASGAGLASTVTGGVLAGATNGEEIDALIVKSEKANAALMRGDIDTYNTLMPLTADFTLMSPFGGAPSRGTDYTPEKLAAMGRFFRHGTLRQEVVQAYGSPDMVVLAIIERAHVEVGGLPVQDWALRVTLVYRREASGWQLAHRHADPLANGISLKQSAALARGDKHAAE